MNAKVTATIAVAVAALMVFAAAGATTYSWFSDSESTEITVNTATVQMDVEYKLDGVVINNPESGIVINNLAANQTHTFTLTYENNSSIATAYKLEALVIGELTENMKDNITLDGVEISDNPLVITKEDGDRGWDYLEAYAEPGTDAVISFDLVTAAGYSEQGKNFKIKLDSKLFQASAVSTKVPVNGGAAKAQVMTDDGKNVDVSVSGLPNGATTFTVESVPVSVNEGFRAGAIALDFKTNVPFDGEPVTIVVSVPEYVTSVVYLGNDGDQPDYISCTDSDGDGIWTLSFTTTHFSTYVLNPAVAEYDDTSGVDYADTLKDAVSCADDGSEIRVLRDSVGAGIVIDKNLTIDFGGFTYTVGGPAVGSLGTETLGFQILKENNVTLKNGRISCDNSNIPENTKPIKRLIQNYATLTLDNLVVDGSDVYQDYVNYGGVMYVVSNNSGNVTINDSTIIATGDDYAFDVYKNPSYSAPKVTVSGDSKIYGAIEVTESIKTNFDATSGTFYVGDAETLKNLSGKTGIDIVLTGDINMTSTLVFNGGVLDGSGHELYFNNQDQTSNWGVDVRAGTVKNLSISGESMGDKGFRASGSNGNLVGDVTFDNVTFHGTYTFNFNTSNSSDYNVSVNNCKLFGWTSYGTIKSMDFRSCSFHYNDDTGQGRLRPYVDTTLKDCYFYKNGGHFVIDIGDGGNGSIDTFTFENCYYEGTLMTSNNKDLWFDGGEVGYFVFN